MAQPSTLAWPDAAGRVGLRSGAGSVLGGSAVGSGPPDGARQAGSFSAAFTLM